jgi:putative hydrolase of the HAD superfamily
MGGTLEDVVHKPEFNLPCGERLLDYLAGHGIRFCLSPGDFMSRLEGRHKDYKKWAADQNRELSPFELWSGWFLKDMDYNRDRLQIIADNLAGLWELNYYHRALRPEAPAMLRELKGMGFSLGIISNTSSHTQVIGSLLQYGIHHYFNCIYLSVTSGFRKPKPEIFLAAARDLGVLPDECVYVGDTVSRDVRGARLAGYAASVRIDSLLSAGSDTGIKQEGEEADYLITGLNEIPGIANKLRETKKEKGDML